MFSKAYMFFALNLVESVWVVRLTLPVYVTFWPNDLDNVTD